ncbi:MAG: hypothetical protein IJ736_10310 [Firmicutes bacterium]|nr:hypothetical protein [Bacillota bacterium]
MVLCIDSYKDNYCAAQYDCKGQTCVVQSELCSDGNRMCLYVRSYKYYAVYLWYMIFASQIHESIDDVAQ